MALMILGCVCFKTLTFKTILITDLFNPRKSLDMSNKEHEYGPIDSIMTVIKPCEERRRLNCWENFTYKITYREDYLSVKNTTVTFHNS